MNRDRVKNISLLALTALGIGAAIYLLKKDKRDLMKSQYYNDPNVDERTEETEDTDDDLHEDVEIVSNPSPEDRYQSLVDGIMDNNFFGKDDIRLGIDDINEVVISNDELLLVKFNRNSTEFILRLDDILVKGEQDKEDDTFSNIRTLIDEVATKLGNQDVLSIIKQINFIPYNSEYRSLKDLNSVSGLRLISVKLYNVDSKFEEELIMLLHPEGGEEDGIESLFNLTPVCIAHPRSELNVTYKSYNFEGQKKTEE